MTTAIWTTADAPGEPLTHFWSTFAGAGRADEGLRASWQEQLRTAADACGFRTVAPRTETVHADARGELRRTRTLAPRSVLLVRQVEGAS
jgi:hypothetical protein